MHKGPLMRKNIGKHIESSGVKREDTIEVQVFWEEWIEVLTFRMQRYASLRQWSLSKSECLERNVSMLKVFRVAAEES